METLRNYAACEPMKCEAEPQLRIQEIVSGMHEASSKLGNVLEESYMMIYGKSVPFADSKNPECMMDALLEVKAQLMRCLEIAIGMREGL